jgi:hypothetical protein
VVLWVFYAENILFSGNHQNHSFFDENRSKRVIFERLAIYHSAIPINSCINSASSLT